MLYWPSSFGDSFRGYADSLTEGVRRLVSVQDVDEIFAPRISDEDAKAFFPEFAAYRQPDASAHLFTRFSRLPSQWQPLWHSRLWLNTLGAISVYDNQLRDFLSREGPISTSERASQVIGPAIASNWRFALWSFATSATAPRETFFRFDMLALSCCFVIETVESRIAGRPGGWRLVEEVLHVLDALGTEVGIPWIHTLATSPDAADLFRHYGFSDAPRSAAFFTSRATPLRRPVRPPGRLFGAPPPDLQKLFQ